MSSVHHDDHDEFLEWEIRGRGWLVWPHPVELEPPFRPFVSSAIAGCESREMIREPLPPVALESSPLEVFRPLSVPRNGLRRLVRECVKLPCPLTIEIHWCEERRSVRLVTRSSAGTALKDLASSRAGMVLQKAQNPFADWDERPGSMIAIAEWGLDGEFMLPIGRGPGSINALRNWYAAFEALGSGERAALQIMLQSARAPWSGSMRSAVDQYGFEFDDEQHRLIGRKLQRPLLSTVVRTAVLAGSSPTTSSILAFQPETPDENRGGWNRLVPVPASPSVRHDLQKRTTHRSGMLLTVDELIALLPDADLRA